MKTITEFSGFAVREAQKKAKEIRDSLGTEGKTPEELTQAFNDSFNSYLGERFKLEGERLAHFLKAVEASESKPRELENLKRVVVLAAAEGEHKYHTEYLASLRPQAPADRRQAGSKHDKKKGSRGRKRPDLKGKRPDGGPERRGANAGTPKQAQAAENNKKS